MGALLDKYEKAYLDMLDKPHEGRVSHPAVWISTDWEIDTEFLIQESDAQERLQALADTDPELFKCVMCGMNMRMEAMGKPRSQFGQFDLTDLYVDVDEARYILDNRDW